MSKQQEGYIDLPKCGDENVNGLLVAIVKQAVYDWKSLCYAERNGKKEWNGKSVKWGFQEIEAFCKKSHIFDALTIDGEEMLRLLREIRVKTTQKHL